MTRSNRLRIVTGGREILACPSEFSRRLTAAGGRNLYGEPNFRIVWGWSRLEWVSGLTTELDENGNFIREIHRTQLQPREFHSCSEVCEGWYVGHRYERWLLEAWKPASYFGSPESWYRSTGHFDGLRMVAGLGPYPTRGDYETQYALEDAERQFLPLTSGAIDDMIVGIRVARARTMQQVRASIKAKLEKRTNTSAVAMDRLDDAIDRGLSRFRIRVGYTGDGKQNVKEQARCA